MKLITHKTTVTPRLSSQKHMKYKTLFYNSNPVTMH